MLLRVVYIQILYNVAYKLHLKYTFLRCLTMGSMACYQYMRSVYNRGLLVISVSHLLSRVGAGILNLVPFPGSVEYQQGTDLRVELPYSCTSTGALYAT